MITSVGSGGSKKDVFASSIRERGQETTELKTAAGEAEARVCPVVQPRKARMHVTGLELAEAGRVDTEVKPSLH